MAKRVHPAPKVREGNVLFSISIHAKDVKIRKTQPPGTQTHKSRKTYRRKPKHPHRSDE